METKLDFTIVSKSGTEKFRVIELSKTFIVIDKHGSVHELESMSYSPRERRLTDAVEHVLEQITDATDFPKPENAESPS